MKPLALLLLLLFNFGLNCFAQNFQLHLIGSSDSENKTLDSLNYNSNHKNAKSINDEIIAVTEKLSKIGFIENRILENTKKNDSSYTAKLSLGERIKFIHIYIGRKSLSPTLSKGEGAETTKTDAILYSNAVIEDLIGLEKTKDTIILPYGEIESYLNQTLQKLEQKGFALAKLKLINIQKRNQTLYSELQFESNQQRRLNSIVLKYAESNKKNSFPGGHLAQINRKYHNSTFNKDIVRRIHDDFEKFGFVSQVKYPEILFTKDTTKVYVYLEKRKFNTFDGFIGFSNDENNKIRFNGYLDVTLKNTLRVGEQFSLYWKSDSNTQKTFRTGIELPYLFKSPISLKARIHIFKQDSTYQNTKTAIDLGYFVDYNTRIYLGYESTESSDIQNTNSYALSDYKNSYLTSNLEYSKLDYTNSIFPKKSSLSLGMGMGKRTTNNLTKTAGTNKQFYINLDAMHSLYLNKKNCINIKSQNYHLKSDTYIINELFRFGGSNSIRGFAENSLQANFMTAIISEYRYIISPSLYLHSIIDYGYYQDKSTNNKGNLVGLGLGVGLSTKNGLLKLAFANGSTKEQIIKSTNSIVHVSFKTNF